jgi:hypothetical protein
MKLKYLSNFNVAIFLKQIKKQTSLNNSQLAKELSLNKSMIWRYSKNLNPIRYDLFLKLCLLADLDPNNFNYSLYIPRNHNKFITIPKISSELAEFIGILLGDGHLAPKNYGIIVSCGLIDLPYIWKYIPELSFKLFAKPMLANITISDKGTTFQSLFYSKEALFFLSKNYNLSIGKKLNPKIPPSFFKKPNLLKSCLRGLIDTDGGIYRHNKKSVQICFYNSSPTLLKSVMKAFLILGFSPYFYWNKKTEKGTISITGKDSLIFMKTISLSNPKNLLKYQYYLNKGYIPNNDYVLNLIINSKNEIIENIKNRESFSNHTRE